MSWVRVLEKMCLRIFSCVIQRSVSNDHAYDVLSGNKEWQKCKNPSYFAAGGTLFITMSVELTAHCSNDHREKTLNGKIKRLRLAKESANRLNCKYSANRSIIKGPQWLFTPCGGKMIDN